MAEFFSQLWFSLFETTSAVVILLFGWYFARVVAYNAANFFEVHFYQKFKKLDWQIFQWFDHWFGVLRFINEFIKWWIFLFFCAVAAAAVGFGAAGRFLGKILKYAAQGFFIVIVFLGAKLIIDFSNRFLVKYLSKIHNFIIVKQIIVTAIWLAAALAIACIINIISLHYFVVFVGIIVIVAFLISIILGSGVRGYLTKTINRVKISLRKNNKKSK